MNATQKSSIEIAAKIATVLPLPQMLELTRVLTESVDT